VLRVHYLGHAAFVLSFDEGVRVLIDYGRSRAYGLDSPVHDLGGLQPDVVIYSHDHEDHAGGVLPEGARRVLRGDSVTLGALRIQAIPTYERSTTTPDNFSHLLEYRGLRVLHLGDCQGLITHIGEPEIRARVAAAYPGPYDLVLMPIGFISDILASAAEFLLLLPATRVVPMHYWSPADKEAFLVQLAGRRTVGGNTVVVERGGPSLELPLPRPPQKTVVVVGLSPASFDSAVPAAP
jgi:L-ascorbate metabolism protein UlaG (beta-lactamase superfamily)